MLIVIHNIDKKWNTYIYTTNFFKEVSNLKH